MSAAPKSRLPAVLAIDDEVRSLEALRRTLGRSCAAASCPMSWGKRPSSAICWRSQPSSGSLPPKKVRAGLTSA